MIDFGIKFAFLAASYANWASSTIPINHSVFNSLNLKISDINKWYTYLEAYFAATITTDCTADFNFTVFQSSCSEPSNHLVFDF